MHHIRIVGGDFAPHLSLEVTDDGFVFQAHEDELPEVISPEGLELVAHITPEVAQQFNAAQGVEESVTRERLGAAALPQHGGDVIMKIRFADGRDIIGVTDIVTAKLVDKLSPVVHSRMSWEQMAAYDRAMEKVRQRTRPGEPMMQFSPPTEAAGSQLTTLLVVASIVLGLVLVSLLAYEALR